MQTCTFAMVKISKQQTFLYYCKVKLQLFVYVILRHTFFRVIMHGKFIFPFFMKLLQPPNPINY